MICDRSGTRRVTCSTTNSTVARSSTCCKELNESDIFISDSTVGKWITAIVEKPLDEMLYIRFAFQGKDETWIYADQENVAPHMAMQNSYGVSDQSSKSCRCDTGLALKRKFTNSGRSSRRRRVLQLSRCHRRERFTTSTTKRYLTELARRATTRSPKPSHS